jgi:hypothetical protein
LHAQNTQFPFYDLDKSITLRSLFGTDTQRGVLTGLSRERNLRSKI